MIFTVFACGNPRVFRSFSAATRAVIHTNFINIFVSFCSSNAQKFGQISLDGRGFASGALKLVHPRSAINSAENCGHNVCGKSGWFSSSGRPLRGPEDCSSGILINPSRRRVTGDSRYRELTGHKRIAPRLTLQWLCTRPTVAGAGMANHVSSP